MPSVDAQPARTSPECVQNPRAAGCNAKPAASTELVHTVATSKPRAQLSDPLIAPARRAAKAREWRKAIPLYQALVVARGPGSEEAKELAQLWSLAGQSEDAAEAWEAYAEATKDEKARAEALAEAARLATMQTAAGEKLSPEPLANDAKKMFALGRAAFKAKRFGDALVYFHMGYALAPELPGFLRELGATYEKLGAAPQKQELYRRYLVQRPFGPNADLVRAELGKDAKALGRLVISSSLPCTELWVNRQRVSAKLPPGGLVVAPGQYKGLCFSPEREMALFEYATVEAGKSTPMSFTWAIIENRLEQPFGRIVLENAKVKDMMVDLGISSREIGVAAPVDGRPLKMVLKDDLGVRTEARQVTIKPGQRLVVRW